MIYYGETLTGSVVHMTRQMPPYHNGTLIKTLCGETIVASIDGGEPMGDRRQCKLCLRLLEKKA